MWRQRSCTLWLHKGDDNTRFFHSRATHRFWHNRIEVLENSMGERCVDKGEIATILIEFYNNLFSSSSPDQIEEATPLVITDEMTHELAAPFQRTEVDLALK